MGFGWRKKQNSGGQLTRGPEVVTIREAQKSLFQRKPVKKEKKPSFSSEGCRSRRSVFSQDSTGTNHERVKNKTSGGRLG